MIIAIRIVLGIAALLVLYPFLSVCSWNFFDPNYWDFTCVARFTASTIGIPLAIASIVGFIKKSKDIFWNTFVGALFIGAVALFILMSV